jgi:hypothetical protein
VKAEWTSATPAVAKVTLGDDSVKHTLELEAMSAAALEQVATYFRGANATRIPRGNISGEVVFVAAKSHATIDAAGTFWKAEYGRLNQKGKLELTFTETVLTFDNATLRAVQVQPIGLRWRIRYTFGTSTMT